MVELKAFLGNLLLFSVEIVEKLFQTKADLPLEGIFFALNFLPWEFLSVKKLEIKKTKTTYHKVVSSNTPCLEANDGFFKLFMKGRDFHSYVGKYCDFLTKS